MSAMSAGSAKPAQTPAQMKAKTRRIFCSTVLVCEAFVTFFALLVAKDLSDLPGRTLAVVGTVSILACFFLTGSLRKPWAYPAGGVLQVLLIVSGWWVPAMYFLGALFLALWVLAYVLSSRVETFQQAKAARGD